MCVFRPLPRVVGRVADDGLGVIWECDNCHVIEEIDNYDDQPAGWLIEEPDEDDYPEDEEVPWDLILCAKCRAPEYVPEVRSSPRDYCRTSWRDPDSMRVHVCLERGEHPEHICDACGPEVRTPPGTHRP